VSKKKEHTPGDGWVTRLNRLKAAQLSHEELAYMIPSANELVLDAAKRLHLRITEDDGLRHLRYYRQELADAKWYYDQVNQLWRDSYPTPVRRPLLYMPKVVKKKGKTPQRQFGGAKGVDYVSETDHGEREAVRTANLRRAGKAAHEAARAIAKQRESDHGRQQ
jgi:hypothetical protein